MNACEFQNQAFAQNAFPPGSTAQLMDCAVVRVIRRAMVVVLQKHQAVTGIALLVDLAHMHLCEGGANGPAWHEGGADNPEFYRLSCVALDELRRGGFLVSRQRGEHVVIELARRPALQQPVEPVASSGLVQAAVMTTPIAQPISGPSLRGASEAIRTLLTLPRFSSANPGRIRFSLSGAVVAGVSMTAVGAAMTGCMAPMAYDQPRYSYFLPNQRDAEIHALANSGRTDEAAIPSRLQALPTSALTDASIPAADAMPVTAQPNSTVASALATEIASVLKAAKPASASPAPMSTASADPGGNAQHSSSLKLKADARFESVKRIVSFDYASSQMNAEAQQQLRLIVPLALQATQVKVKGTTDSSGDAASNRRLALNRAMVVARSLIASGVASSHVKATYCTTCFVGSNDSDDGRRSNRRVDVEMVMPVGYEGMAASALPASSTGGRR